MRPAGLHHANLGIGEVVNYTLQKIFGRYEIRVEDGDKLALRRLETFCERTRLEALAIRAMVVADGESLGSVVIDQSTCHGHSFISRVVEHLNIQFLQWIIQATNGIQQALDHELFVEDWKLHGDAGQI